MAIKKAKPVFSSSQKRKASDLIDFINQSPTPYHAVEETIARLKKAGFSSLDEGREWDLKANGKYYVVRNGASIAAFVLGRHAPDKGVGFHIVGAHTDSPCLKLKPKPNFEKFNYAQLGVEEYGGVLLGTWTDRDLGVAGRISFEDPRTGKLKNKNVKVNEPIARVPQLAIHLNRNVNDKGLVLNKQKHLPPVYSLIHGKGDPWSKFMAKVSRSAGCRTRDILGFDLSLFDVHEAGFGGQDGEFIFAPRLDNLAMCHAALNALTETSKKKTELTRVSVFFDHEEVGSTSAQGGDSNFLDSILERVHGLNDRQTWFRCLSNSRFISADMAHAVHPNYGEKHDPHHQPLIGHGPVIKNNAKLRYATDGSISSEFVQWCRKAKVPHQSFVNRTDLGCGSTIGPMNAARLGIQTIDVGNPMLSMHSIREMCGTGDHEMMIKVLKTFYSI
jgi:aspartyl aminopeptidase